MAEIKYIPYRDDEIDEEAFWKKADEEYENYLNSRMWARNSPEKRNLWIQSYNNLRNMGVTGITGTNINHNGIAPIDNREYYGDVADFLIRNIAPNIKTKKALEEEAKKKEEERIAALPVYSFDSDFTKYLINTEYGGNKENFQNDWNNLDKADKFGIRKNKNRKDRLLNILTNYRDQLQFDNFRYGTEDSPFSNKEDLIERLDGAIAALKSPDPNDDNEHLNKLGLSSNFLSTGENNRITYGGQQMTAAEARDLEAKTTKQAEAEKIKQQKANQFKKVRFIPMNRVNGTLPQGQNVLEELNNYYNLGQLSPEQISKLVGTFKFAQKNNALKDLSKEELARFGSTYANNPGRLKKIDGLNGFYYDTIGNRIIQPFMDTQGGTQNLQELINQNSPEQQRLRASQRKLGTIGKDWETEDYLRMGAMAQDIAGATSAWFGPYGMAASGILGLTSLGTNLAADVADESLTWGDRAKNVGVNLGLAAVGMVPGLGLASRTGKWLTNIAKWAPRLLTIQALKDTPEVYASIKKAIDNPSELTNQDWKNIGYGLSIAAGLSRGAKGIVNNRKFKPTTQGQTKTYTKTKSGKEIEITKKQEKAINKAGRKGGNDKANEELRKIQGAENEEVNVEFKTGLKERFNSDNKLKTYTKNVGQSPEVQRYSRALSIKNVRDKRNHPILSRFLSTDYDIYQKAAQFPNTNIGIVDRIKQTWNPVSNRPFKGKQQQTNTQSNPQSSTTQTTSTQNNVSPTGSNAKPKPPVLSKTESNELKTTLKGENFSTNEFKNESRVVGSVRGFGDLYGIRNSDGTHTLEIDFGGIRVNVNGTKADIKSKTLEVLRKDVMKRIDQQVPKQNRSRIKYELIKQLKQNGYLKYGGTLNNRDVDSIIQKYLN